MSRDLLSGLLPSGDPFAPFDAEAYRASFASQPPTLAPPAAPTPRPVVIQQPPRPVVIQEPPQPVIIQQPQPVIIEEPPRPAAIQELPPPVVIEEPPRPVVIEEPLEPVAEAILFAAPIPIPMGVPVGESADNSGYAAAGFSPRHPSPTGSKKSRRKRRTSYAGPLMAVFAILMFAGIAGCLYLLVTGRGLSTDGRMIATNTQENPNRADGRREAGRADDNASPEFDPVMGSPRPRMTRPAGGMDSSDRMMAQSDEPETMVAGGMPDAVPDANSVESPVESPAAEMETTSEMTNMDAAGDNRPMETTESTEANDSMEPADSSMALAPQPNSQPNSQAQTPEMLAGEAALEQVRSVLQSGRFGDMAPAVKAATAAMVTTEQKEELASYGLLVELADYYIEGMRRGAAKQGVGEAFDVTPGFTVGVVEGTRDKLALKVNGKIKSYSIDTIPLILAERMAAFGLPADDPEVVAGRAAYQALWSQATPAHRAQAIDWLEQLAGKTDRFDAQVLSAAIASLFE